MVLLISYDLNGKERPASYARVRLAIERRASASHKLLYSQWWVQTQQSPEWWVDQLQPHLDSDDRLFVCRVDPRGYQGLLTSTDWNWLETHL